MERRAIASAISQRLLLPFSNTGVTNTLKICENIKFNIFDFGSLPTFSTPVVITNDIGTMLFFSEEIFSASVLF